MNKKKILIATDFSPGAHNATLYGMQLAKAMRADAILFSACYLEPPSGARNVKVWHIALMEETKKKLADEADALVKEHDIQLEIDCREGPPHEAILAIAKEKSVDLVVVGMKDSGKDVKQLFGSTTTSLVNNLLTPTITVPPGTSFTTPENILYASDVFLDTSISPIDQVKWLTDFFESKLFVIRVVRDSYEEGRENVNTSLNLGAGLQTLNTSFSFPVDKNVTNGSTESVREQIVDLVIMMPRNEEWLGRLFVKSDKKDMMFHSHVPILMLPDTTISKRDAVQTTDNDGYHKMGRI